MSLQGENKEQLLHITRTLFSLHILFDVWNEMLNLYFVKKELNK